MSLSMQAQRKEVFLFISLEGQLTRADTNSFKEWSAEQANEEGIERVEIDCSELTYLDSAGLGSLIYLRKVLDDRGVSLQLTEVSGWLKKFLQVTGLEQAFTGNAGTSRPERQS